MRLVTRLHQWDVLRANKAPFAFGLETRVPFLDKQFLQVCRGVLRCCWAGPTRQRWLAGRRNRAARGGKHCTCIGAMVHTRTHMHPCPSHLPGVHEH